MWELKIFACLEVALGLSMAGIRLQPSHAKQKSTTSWPQTAGDFVAFVGTVCLMADESQHGDGFTGTQLPLGWPVATIPTGARHCPGLSDSCNAATVPDMVVCRAQAVWGSSWQCRGTMLYQTC